MKQDDTEWHKIIDNIVSLINKKAFCHFDEERGEILYERHITPMWNYNFYVYITTNPDRSVLYVGVTNDLARRLYEHTENKDSTKTFAGKYYCCNLVYYEHFSNVEHAIEREKEIKKWRRSKKDDLISAFNCDWKFLNDTIID